jgi:TetR/AcrR family transcriptional regulator
MPTPTSVHRRHTEILAAAQSLFARYGQAKVTMEEIAADVGLGKASLYYYFPTKEDLFRAVIEHEQELFLERLEPVVRLEASTAVKLREYMTRRMQYFRDYINLSTFSLQTFLHPDPAFGNLYLALNAHDRRMIGSILQEGIDRGEIAGIDAQEYAELLQHLLQGLRFRILKMSGSTPAAAQYEEMQRDIDRLADLVTRALDNHP